MLAEHADKGLTGEQMVELVEAAYPFGERCMHPYKVWRKEVAKLRATLSSQEPVTDVILRACPACGAECGKPCRDYVKRWEPGTHRPTLPSGEFHDARSTGAYLDVRK